MARYDLINKINIFDLISGLIGPAANPYCLIKQAFGLSDLWQASIFNWGRNSLYWFFKSLEYETITFPAFTCPTLTEAAEKAQKKVELIDVDLDTFNLDWQKITSKCQCLVAVHTFGNPLNINLLKKQNPYMFIIEDWAHALFSTINGSNLKPTGEAILLSLYKQVANINGAFLLTKKIWWPEHESETNWEYGKRLFYKLNSPLQYLLDIKRKQYFPGIENQPLNKKQPSRLCKKLFSFGFRQLEKEINKRRILAKHYDREINASPFLIKQKLAQNCKSSYYQYPVRLKKEYKHIRDNVIFGLRQKNIFAACLWPDAPIALDKYRKFQKICPNSLLLTETVLNLPIDASYKANDIKHICQTINVVIKKLI